MNLRNNKANTKANARTNAKTNSKEKKFTIRMQKKLVVLFVIVLLAFAGLSVQLVIINRDSGEKYKKQILEQQEYSSITIPYRRGDILDRKGTILAASEKVYNLVVDASVIMSDEKNFEPTMAALEACFDLDMNTIRNHVKSNPGSAYYVAVKTLTYDQIFPFMEMKNDTKKNPYIKGIWFEEEFRRQYPNGTLACDVIGFNSVDNVGTYGLEEFYNDELNGTTGREYGYLNEDSNLERTTKPAVDGNSLISTIDVNVQSIIEKHLKIFNDAHKDVARPGNGANNLGCIIMDVNSGEILGMASYPVFDLNNPKDLSAYYTEEEIATMEADGTYYDTLNQLWRNFCVSDSYEPGSTMKPFTLAMGLETAKLTGEESYECTGLLNVGGKNIKCHNYKYGGDGWVNLKEAMEQSCNVALMYMGLAIGKDIFADYQRTFNFGLKTNIDLSGEARTAELLYTKETMGPTELATNSFGQGFNTTMVQMISGFCSLINGGYYYEPHMVSKIVSPSGATVKTIEPRVLRQTISKSTSDTVIEYCNGVTVNGTGKSARPAGYAIGGKTGTAETLPRGNREYVVSFMGYAPADDPQIAIYTVIDRVNESKQDNVKYATVLTRDILTEVLPYLGIYMTEELSEAEVLELEQKKLEITNQYAPKPDEDSVSDGDATEEPKEGETDQEGEDDKTMKTPWKDFPIDPTTGYAVNPETGEKVDPETGESMDGSFSAFD